MLGSRVVEPLVRCAIVRSSRKLSPFRFIAGISPDFEIVTPLLPSLFSSDFYFNFSFFFFMNISLVKIISSFRFIDRFRDRYFFSCFLWIFINFFSNQK